MWISAGAIVAFTAAVFFSTKAIFVKLTYLYGADAISALALRMNCPVDGCNCEFSVSFKIGRAHV